MIFLSYSLDTLCLRVYRNGFGVLRFRNLACIPPHGGGGPAGWWGLTPLVASRHSLIGGELCIPPLSFRGFFFVPCCVSESGWHSQWESNPYCQNENLVS